ncbi:MAG: STAS domain-containing protein [Magnetococcus sp. YQC-5]
MPATLSVARTGQETTINIKGRFCYDMHTLFREAYLEETKDKRTNRRFVVDLAGTEYIDSSALGMLLLLREETDTNDANVEIVNARPEVLKILTTANFDRLFKIR